MPQSVAAPRAPAAAHRTAPGRARAALLSFVFILSGITGLAYEVIWSRYLAAVLGNSSYAHAVVLASFLGGLALGNAIVGRRADASGDPLRLYGWLEVGIGALAGVSPALMTLLQGGYIGLLRGLDVPPAAVPVLEAAIAVVALLPATILMGGTLPTLGAYLTDRLSRLQSAVSWLYFLNSAGAAGGALVTGFVVIPALGLDRATSVFAFVNVAIGVVAIGLARRGLPAGTANGVGESAGTGAADHAGTADHAGAADKARPVDPVDSADRDDAPCYGDRQIRLLLAATFISGFVSLAYEIAWIRLLSLVMGSSAYSFALMLGAFISGIALGSLLVNRGVLPGRDPLAQFGFAQAGAALSIALTLPLYDRLPYVFVQLGNVINRSPANFGLFQGLEFLICAALMLLPTTLIGMTLPLASRVATRSVREVGARVGGVFGLNTFGNVLGATVSGLWLLPLLGIRGLIEAGVAVNTMLAIAVLLAALRLGRTWRTALVLGPLAVLVLVRGLSPAWDMEMLSSGVFRFRASLPAGTTYESLKRTLGNFQTLYHRDDAHGTVTVTESDGDLKLRVNGKVDATAKGDLPTQILLGQIPLVLRPDARDVLVVGLGSGITLGTALSHPVRSVDVVEISPAVAEAARFFAAHNRNALQDPRVRVHVEDALAYLQLDRARHDLIISEPSNPWMAGVGNLFTREFYRLAKQRLAPGGLVAQWIHTYEMDDETVGLVLRTFADAFPHVTVWHTQGRDCLLLGSVDRLELDFERSAAAVRVPAVAAELRRLGIGGLADVLALQKATDRRVRMMAGDGPLNTVRHPLLEYRAPIAFFADTAAELVNENDERLKVPKGTVRDLALLAYLRSADRVLDAYEFARIVAYHEKWKAQPGVVRMFATEWSRRFPRDSRAWAALTRHYTKAGDRETARLMAERALQLAPRDADALFAIADLEFARFFDTKGFLADSSLAVADLEASLRALLELRPETRGDTLRRLGAVRLASGDFAGAEGVLDQAAASFDRTRLPPAAQDDVVRIWVAAADVAAELDEAAWAYHFARKALQRRPADPRLRSLVGTMARAAAPTASGSASTSRPFISAPGKTRTR